MFADKVLKNGNIYSFDIKGRTALGSAVAVTGEKITAVGTDREIERFTGPETEVIECNGNTVMPGFVDAHAHPSIAASIFENCSLFEITAEKEESSREAAQKYVRCMAEFIKKNENQKVYRGTGWNRAYFVSACKNPQLPTRHDLDRICKDKPIVLESYCQHAIWVNSKAIELAGLTKDTPDPETGSFTRESDGYPAGVFFEYDGTALIKENMPGYDYTVEQYKKTILRFQEEIALPKGILCVNDCLTTENAIEAFKQLAQEKKLKMRFRGVYNFADCRNLDYIDRIDARKGTDNVNDLFEINTIKTFIEGEPAMLSPYTAQSNEARKLPQDYCGISFYTDNELAQAYKKAAETGLQMHIHAMGDKSVKQAIGALSSAQKQTGKTNRNVIAHLMAVEEGDYKKIAENNIIANIQPRWMTYDADIEDNSILLFGKERAMNLYPNGRFVKAGCNVAYGTDFPITDINPFYGIEYAVTRTVSEDDEAFEQKYKGKVLGEEPDVRKDCVSVDDAVKSYTYMGAYQNFMESYTGSIEAGKSADIIILDKNIEKISKDEIHKLKPVMTIFKGDIVYREKL